MKTAHELDLDLLLEMLEDERTDRRLSWRQVAKEIGVTPSTFTRMAQGRKPSVDAFLSMREWCGAHAEELTVENTILTPRITVSFSDESSNQAKLESEA